MSVPYYVSECATKEEVETLTPPRPPPDRQEAGPDRRATRNTGTKRGDALAFALHALTVSSSDSVGISAIGAEEGQGKQTHHRNQTSLIMATRRGAHSVIPSERYTRGMAAVSSPQS